MKLSNFLSNTKRFFGEMLKDSLDKYKTILWRNTKRFFGEILKVSLEKC